MTDVETALSFARADEASNDVQGMLAIIRELAVIATDQVDGGPRVNVIEAIRLVAERAGGDAGAVASWFAAESHRQRN